ncbi:hypothetical protein B7494_g2301 [Chlorociboria aeruginascens]|nr:hypothetical protein B7494_g2301 [Chlorociboria aeruginascens]
MASAISSELEHVRGVWQNMKGNSPIYDFLLSDAIIIAASRGTVTSRLLLQNNHVNSKGTLHGAVTAALVDWSGGLAIASHGMEKTGASIDIHISYISTARVGETLEIEAATNKVGRSIAFTTIRIVKLVDGKPGPIVATASHNKYIQQAGASNTATETPSSLRPS